MSEVPLYLYIRTHTFLGADGWASCLHDRPLLPAQYGWTCVLARGTPAAMHGRLRLCQQARIRLTPRAVNRCAMLELLANKDTRPPRSMQKAFAPRWS